MTCGEWVVTMNWTRGNARIRSSAPWPHRRLQRAEPMSYFGVNIVEIDAPESYFQTLAAIKSFPPLTGV